MGKPVREPLPRNEILGHFNESRDLQFELEILSQLEALGITCEHGGTYVDPNSRKARQFDIRGRMRVGKLELRLSVECKNVGDHYPVCIRGVPRSSREAFHDVIVAMPHSKQAGLPAISFPAAEAAEAIRVTGDLSLYRDGELVGKSVSQVGLGADGDRVESDRELFSKWTQGLSAIEASLSDVDPSDQLIIAAMPVVVVPAGRLFAADVTSGEIGVEDVAVDSCSYWIDHSVAVGDRVGGCSMSISHLEFVTPNGLERLLVDRVGIERDLSGALPAARVHDAWLQSRFGDR